MAFKRFKRRGRKGGKKGGKKMTKLIRSVIRGDMQHKHLMLSTSGAPVTLSNITPASLYYLGGWVPGSQWGQRIGQRIRLMYVDVYVYISWFANVGVCDSNLLRIAMVMNKQTEGANPVLQNDDSGLFRGTGFTVGDYTSTPWNPTTCHKKGSKIKDVLYTIYHDKTVQLPMYLTDLAAGTTVPDVRYRVFHFRKFWKGGLIMNFDTGTAGNITDSIDNSVFMCYLSNLVTAGHGSITISTKSDICYEDA